jgi:hypothetical protein
MVMQKISIRSGICRIIFICLLAILKLHTGNTQVAVEATVSDPSPAPGDLVDITISVTAEIDFFYAEMEVIYNMNTLEFSGLSNGSLAADGINVAGDLSPGRKGISVSRTMPLETAASGSIITLTFKVADNAGGGDTEISFANLLILDPAAIPLPSAMPGPVMLNVKTTISRLQLLVPAENTIEEGGLFHAGAMVYASGVTDNLRITCQVGVNPVSSDPAAWPDDLWSDMEYIRTDENGNLIFSSEIAVNKSPGQWFISVRSSLDGGEYVFGGHDGLTGPPGPTPASLTIIPRPPFKYSLAFWDFNNESRLPSLAVNMNRGAEVRIHGAAIDGFSAGFGGLALNSKNWAPQGGGLCYWFVEISTAGFTRLEISSRQYGSGTGPRDFRLEYSLDGFEWHPVADGEIVVATNWSSGRLDRLPLPGIIEDRDRVLLRWINTSEISINGAITGTAGTSRIDDVLITGVNPDPDYVTVYPGDANNDGVVNADDVLPLGYYWLSCGPSSVWDGYDFMPRNIEQWIPSGATWADTNGDGIVDHRDLLAIGLNFGRSTGPLKKDTAAPLASMVIDPLESGHTRVVVIESVPVKFLRGLSIGLELTGIPPDMWEIGRTVPLFAGKTPGNELISLTWTGDNMFEAAFAFKGHDAGRAESPLLGFELLINEQWTEPFTVNLNRMTVSCNNSAGTGIREAALIPADVLSPVTGAPDTDYGLRLGFHPNPFRSESTISFSLENPSHVRIEITCIQGRRVATVCNEYREKGNHAIAFDGKSLAPGVYLCIMTCATGRRDVVRVIKLAGN